MAPRALASTGWPTVQTLLERYSVRPVRESDLVPIETLAQAHRFGIGIANLLLAYRESPDEWWLIEERGSGLIVSYSGSMLMSNGLIHGVKIFSVPTVRGQGITRLFNLQLDHSGNATAANFANFNSFAMALTFKLNVYAGIPSALKLKSDCSVKVPGFSLHPIDTSNLAEVLRYDAQILPDVDRSRFMGEWICPNVFPATARAVAAYLNGSVVGYGVLRSGWLEKLTTSPITNLNSSPNRPTNLPDSHWFLSPVYAESEGVAYQIIDHLLANHVKPGVEINFECLASNRFMQLLAHDLQLAYKVCEYHRHPASWKYHETRRMINMDKVYAGILEWPL